MKTKLTPLLLVISLMLACKPNADPSYVPKGSVLGHWRYVGKFSHLADYRCIVCPEFDYEKSIYQLTFKADGTFDARINLLIGNGKYSYLESQNNYNPQIYKDLFFSRGTFLVNSLQFLNKPPQTLTDTQLIADLGNVNSYYQTTPTGQQIYHQLNLNLSEGSQYLVFVQKR